MRLFNLRSGIWLGSGILLLLVLLNAWVSDDAYITFRTVFNFTEGHGPVYNIGERVQTYTNPLWMLVVSLFYLFTDEAYYTSIVLSLLLTAGGLFLMQVRVLRLSQGALLVLPLLCLSRSFVEYSTSGLENVLNFFLLMLFLSVLLGDRRDREKLWWLALIAGFGMVSRMDTALLYAPTVFWVWWQQRSVRNLLLVALGLSPFLLWEAFSLVYYGFPFPNTAYAKLNSDLPASELWAHGFYYLGHTLRRDPLTLVLIFGGLGMATRLPKKTWWPLALGVFLYLVYLMKVGGDFMGGRFLYLPVALAVVMLARGMENWRPLRYAVPVLVLLGLLNTRGPLYNWARVDPPHSEKLDQHGIADERAWYADASALSRLTDSSWVMEVEALLDTRKTDTPGEKFLFWDFIGFTGYGAGPGRHVVDRLALADPLLARLPMSVEPGWRIGHYPRIYPRGYQESLKQGLNLLQDKELYEYYGHLHHIVRGPIWEMDRFRAIWNMNLGNYDHLIDKEFYKNPTQMKVLLSELQTRQAAGASFMAPGQLEIWPDRPLRIDLETQAPFARFEIGLHGPNRYKISFLKGKDPVADMMVFPKKDAPEGLAIYALETPAAAIREGFDVIQVETRLGNGYFSIAFLRVLP